MKKYIAEAFGTFVLTLLGCGAAVSLNCGYDAASVVGTAIAFGLSVVAMAYAIGGISGCHINPAITIGTYVAGRTSGKDLVGYICGQVCGAIIAAAVLYAFVSTAPELAGGTTTVSSWRLSSQPYSSLLSSERQARQMARRTTSPALLSVSRLSSSTS